VVWSFLSRLYSRPASPALRVGFTRIRTRTAILCREVFDRAAVGARRCSRTATVTTKQAWAETLGGGRGRAHVRATCAGVTGPCQPVPSEPEESDHVPVQDVGRRRSGYRHAVGLHGPRKRLSLPVLRPALGTFSSPGRGTRPRRDSAPGDRGSAEAPGFARAAARACQGGL
jgi:hypothetical protein